MGIRRWVNGRDIPIERRAEQAALLIEKYLTVAQDITYLAEAQAVLRGEYGELAEAGEGEDVPEWA